jgi:hypothetical protein
MQWNGAINVIYQNTIINFAELMIVRFRPFFDALPNRNGKLEKVKLRVIIS